MNNSERKYAFTWDVIGADMATARPSLGPDTKVEVYRLLQFTLRDVLEKHYGTEAVDMLFSEAGVLAGKAFFERYCKGAKDLNSLVKTIQEQFKALGIGIFRVELADPEGTSLTLTVDEDLDCSGLPDTSDQICVYDEGFIKGILDSFTGEKFVVKEVDCWCAGARTCRFSAKMER